MKIWDASTGAGYTSIEPTEGDINDVCVWPNSGGVLLLGILLRRGVWALCEMSQACVRVAQPRVCFVWMCSVSQVLPHWTT